MTNNYFNDHSNWGDLVTETVPGFPLQYLPADCATLVRK